MEAGSMR